MNLLLRVRTDFFQLLTISILVLFYVCIAPLLKKEGGENKKNEKTEVLVGDRDYFHYLIASVNDFNIRMK